MAFVEYLCQILDDSYNKTKSLTFVISDLNTSHHRALSSFSCQDTFPWINSQSLFSSNEMIIWNYITNQSIHFASQQSLLVNASVKYMIIPPKRINRLNKSVAFFINSPKKIHQKGSIVLYIISSFLQ